MARDDDRTQRRGSRAPLAVALLLGAAVAIGVWIAWSVPSDEGGSEALPEEVVAPPESAAGAESAPQAPPAGSGGYALRFGESLQVPAAWLPSSGPVAFDLVLPEPSANREPLRVKIVDMKARRLDLWASVQGDDRMSARLELDAEWLLPGGGYLIELRTTERTHFPLRRYMLEVR